MASAGREHSGKSNTSRRRSSRSLTARSAAGRPRSGRAWPTAALPGQDLQGALNYAAFDLVVTGEGRWVFLEFNAAGQWDGWPTNWISKRRDPTTITASRDCPALPVSSVEYCTDPRFPGI